ncbi:LemA family protein [Permianibacter sp. IMCC34836]|uniref:LemA family protein n=1 Tax=Permianibacter fluminis TaxID=2738515 RepID=UPI00155299E8|nr:LemA family protein [Permianibacter fluminis]NQD35432.1 LemA family protein [Permianibacter fluminis]
MTTWIVLAIIAVVVVWAIGIYNSLVALRNRFKNSYAQIDVQLNRRYDLIPNLVETAKAYLKHERETLEAVVAARNSALSASKLAAAHPEDAGAVQNVMQADGALTGALTKFFAVAESYPDLKANSTMNTVMEELSSTENKVAFARQAYNDAVMGYNTYREQFPKNLIANNFGFQAAALFEVDNPEVRKAVKVSFS